MTTAIQVGGLVLLAAAAIIMTRPGWRIPVLAFVVLSLPGNVDNLLPQMQLDPHPIEHSLAPIVSFVDVLLVWAVALGLREGRWERIPPPARWALATGLAIAAMAGVSALVAVSAGVDSGSALRGFIVFLRIPALIFVVAGLRDNLRADRVALAIGLAIVTLLANGLYTTITTEADRFTAATFGRNGYSSVLVVTAVIAAALGLDLTEDKEGGRWSHVLGIGFLVLAGAAWFGAVATGSRIGLIVFVVCVGIGLFVDTTWRSRDGLKRVGILGASVVLIAVASGLTTPGGGRLLAAVGIDAGGDPSTDGEASVDVRADFWNLAITMTIEEPLHGFGPYEWNFERYRRDPEAEVVVVDPHNAYLQIGAEYGVPLLVGYAAFLAVVIVAGLRASARARPDGPGFWAVTGLIAAACALPVADLTNSNLFNVRTGLLLWLVVVVALTSVAWAAEPARRTRLGSDL